MFDAYTVKKVLPRLFIAVVLIQLSWFLFTGMINIMNSIAYGVEGLIYAPFGGAGELEFANILWSGVDGGTGLFVGLASGAILGGLVAAVAVGGIVTTGAMVILGIFIAFALLLFRQVIIVALLIVSPLALVAWILPGTEKYWKLWWESFSKLLLVYPIILGMLALGRVMGVVVAGVDPQSAEVGSIGADALFSDPGGTVGQAAATGTTDLINFFLVLACIFGPFYLIPKTFQMAGGVFQTLTGTINNKSKGAFDRLRNRRKQTMAKKWDSVKAGNRFKGGTETNFRGRVNRGLMAGSMIGKAGLNPMHMRTRMRTAMRDSTEAKVEEAMKNDSFNAWSGDDAKLWAARFTDREQIAAALAQRDAGRFGGAANRNRREEAVAQIMRSQREIGAETFQKARLRAQAKTGTGYQDADGNFNAALMMDDINSVYGNDRNGAGKALAEMRGALTQSGQVAGQAGYGIWAEQMERRHNNTTSQLAAHNEVMDDAIDSVQPGYAVYGKPSSAAAFGAAHNRRIQSIAQGIQAGTHTVDDLSAAVAHAAGIADAMGQASPGNADAFVNELFGQGVSVPDAELRAMGLVAGPIGPIDPNNPTYSTISVRDLVDTQMGGNAEFIARRSTMSARTAAGAQLIQQQQNPNPGGSGPAPGRPQVPPSDRRLKKNIRFISKTNSGISLYSFQYLWDNQIYVGVMAQDLIGTMFENAVYVDSYGYYRVDYRILGIEMQTLEQWIITKNGNPVI